MCYQVYHNILSIPAKVLYEDLQLVSYTTYKLWCYRKKINRIKAGKGKGNTALIEFSTLPEDIKEKIIEVYGNPDLHPPNMLERYIQELPDQSHYLHTYQTSDGRFLPPEKIQEYYTNAKLLTAGILMTNSYKATRAKHNGKKIPLKELWSEVAYCIDRLNKEKYPHSLPTNWERLYRKVKHYSSHGVETLIPNSWCNKNAIKVEDTQQEASLRQLLRKHQNFDNQQIKLLYNIIADTMHWKRLSASSIANYRKKWHLHTLTGQKGTIEFDNKLAMQVKRSAPVAPMSYWTIDGWTVELLYQKTFTNPKGNKVTTYDNRLTVVIILDPCQKYPIGYAIDTHETPDLIKRALRNAVDHTKELYGKRYKVLQLQSDRYATKSLKPFYQAVSDKYTPARAHNAKAKVIESYFSRLNKKYCQLLPNWSGFGVATGSKKQPNAEYLNKIKKSFPDYNQVVSQIEHIIEMERKQKIDKYKALSCEIQNTHTLVMTDSEYYLFLGEKSKHTYHITGCGLTITVNGNKLSYDSFHPDFRRHSHLAWEVYYNPGDLRQIVAYSKGIHFLLEQKHIQPMALNERKEKDTKELERVKTFNKELKNYLQEQVIGDQHVVEELFSKNKQLEGTLSKLVLTDSQGQHKQRLSQARLHLDTEGAEHREQTKNWQQKQQEYLKGKIDINKFLE